MIELLVTLLLINLLVLCIGFRYISRQITRWSELIIHEINFYGVKK